MLTAKRVLVSILSLATVSCGTICTLTDAHCPPFGPYSGTRASARGHGTQLDIPFSLLLDTILLPFSVPSAARQHRLEASANTRAVLLHTVYMSGGDAPIAQSLVLFEDGYVRLRTAGSQAIWRRLQPRDRHGLEAMVRCPELAEAIDLLDRRFACCDAAEVSLSLGRTHADVDVVRNPPSIPIMEVDRAAPPIRRLLQRRDELGVKLFGRRYFRFGAPPN